MAAGDTEMIFEHGPRNALNPAGTSRPRADQRGDPRLADRRGHPGSTSTRAPVPVFASKWIVSVRPRASAASSGRPRAADCKAAVSPARDRPIVVAGPKHPAEMCSLAKLETWARAFSTKAGAKQFFNGSDRI